MGGASEFMPSAYDRWAGKYFDASWELGDSPMHHSEVNGGQAIPFDTSYGAGSGITTIAGSNNHPTYYSGYRWFEGIDSTLNAATSEVNDPAKLKCHYCNVVRELRWTGSVFELRDPTGTITGNLNGENLWAICNTALKQRSCEYSSGTCFVEERRTWGYVTQVRAGCKQAQACYMQKYQNFLVKAGRQCWPGDHSGMADKIGRRPYDVALYEWPSTDLGWITNIIYGGAAATGTGTSFTSSDAQTGLFVDADYSDFLGIRTPVNYK